MSHSILHIYYNHLNTAAPIITNSTTPSVVNALAQFPVTLYCTSEGSPPDTFIWMKDGVPIAQSTGITTVTHTSTTAVFHTEFTISRTATSDSGTYTCTVINPIGIDSHSVTVNVGKGINIVCTVVL